MKYSLLMILTSFLSAGDIKIACEEHLINLYPVDTDFSMHILLLDKQVKKKVENKVKQKFYRDKLYYWNITQGDSTMAYAFLDNIIGKSMPFITWCVNWKYIPKYKFIRSNVVTLFYNCFKL